MSVILLLNGPNLNLLGNREPQHYGAATLMEIEEAAKIQAENGGYNLVCFQSNSESALINRIHQAINEDVVFILFNPAAYTHTSVALRDALLAVEIPFIEIHLSDPKTRETFRHHSFFSDVAVDVFSGMGPDSYTKAIDAALFWLKQNK